MSNIIKVKNDTFIIPEKQSPCITWQHYYDQLSKAFGKQFAASAWLMSWQKYGSSFCTTDVNFNKWLASKKIDVSTATTRAVADISDIGGNLLGLGKNLSGSIASLPRIIMITGVSILLLVAYLIYNSIKNQQLNLSSIAGMSPTSFLAKSIQ